MIERVVGEDRFSNCTVHRDETEGAVIRGLVQLITHLSNKVFTLLRMDGAGEEHHTAHFGNYRREEGC